MNESQDFFSSPLMGARIRQARVARGLQQKELADRLGYKSQTSISKIETGEKTPTPDVLMKLHGVLSVDIHWLITGKPAPGAMVAAKNYHKLSERLAPYVGYELEHILQEKIRYRAKLEETTNKEMLEQLQKILEECENCYRKILDDLALLRKSPFGGDSWEDSPTSIEKIVMPKTNTQP